MLNEGFRFMAVQSAVAPSMRQSSKVLLEKRSTRFFSFNRVPLESPPLSASMPLDYRSELHAFSLLTA
jgi:hypothetical protein